MLAARMVTRDIRLGNGILCIHRPLSNGSQEVIAVGKERGAFSKEEHEEYRALAAALPHRDTLYVRRPYLEDAWYLPAT